MTEGMKTFVCFALALSLMVLAEAQRHDLQHVYRSRRGAPQGSGPESERRADGRRGEDDPGEKGGPPPPRRPGPPESERPRRPYPPGPPGSGRPRRPHPPGPLESEHRADGRDDDDPGEVGRRPRPHKPRPPHGPPKPQEPNGPLGDVRPGEEAIDECAMDKAGCEWKCESRAGTYICLCPNGMEQSRADHTKCLIIGEPNPAPFAIDGPPNTSDTPQAMSIAIIAAAVGGVVFLLGAALICLCCCRRKPARAPSEDKRGKHPEGKHGKPSGGKRDRLSGPATCQENQYQSTKGIQKGDATKEKKHPRRYDNGAYQPSYDKLAPGSMAPPDDYLTAVPPPYELNAHSHQVTPVPLKGSTYMMAASKAAPGYGSTSDVYESIDYGVTYDNADVTKSPEVTSGKRAQGVYDAGYVDLGSATGRAQVGTGPQVPPRD